MSNRQVIACLTRFIPLLEKKAPGTEEWKEEMVEIIEIVPDAQGHIDDERSPHLLSEEAEIIPLEVENEVGNAAAVVAASPDPSLTATTTATTTSVATTDAIPTAMMETESEPALPPVVIPDTEDPKDTTNSNNTNNKGSDNSYDDKNHNIMTNPHLLRHHPVRRVRTAGPHRQSEHRHGVCLFVAR